MSRILDEINRVCPALGDELSSLPEDERSDLRAMVELGSHVVDLFEAGRLDDVRPAFQFVEHLIAQGSELEREPAIIGFLETVQNVASHRTCGSVAFEPFLGPASASAWAELAEIWRGKTTLAEVVSSENETSTQPHWWQFWRRRTQRTPREMLDQVQDPELRKIIEQITRE